MGINSCSRKKGKKENIRVVTISGLKQVHKFLHWIYDNSNLFLERKFLKAKKVMALETRKFGDAMGNAEALLAMQELGLKMK